ncbi:MAG: hypothetical protein P8Z39_00755 [Gammaproteobacteria bacterium]|jgi:hypothetical protein
MSKKLAGIIATAVLGLTLVGCHSYDYRYSDGTYYYDDVGYAGYGWEPYPAISLNYYSYRDHHRYSHRRHHRDGHYRRW